MKLKLPILRLASLLLTACGTTVVNPVTGQSGRSRVQVPQGSINKNGSWAEIAG